jgi:hypothetical protein
MWSTPPALERLGHLVTPEAPVGLLPGLAVPVPAYDAPQLRFAPAHEDVPSEPVRRSWLPAALTRKAPVVETPAPAAATTSQLMSEAGPDVVSRREVQPVLAAIEASTPRSTPMSIASSVVRTSAASPVPAVAPAATSTPSAPIASPPPAIASAPSIPDAPADGPSEFRPTLGASTSASPESQPLPRPLVRQDAENPLPVPTTVLGAPQSAEQAAGQALHGVAAPVAAITPPLAASLAGQVAKEVPPRVASDGGSLAATALGAAPAGQQSTAAPEMSAPLAIVRDLVGARDLPRALTAQHDVIGPPSTDSNAVRPTPGPTLLGTMWRQAERVIQQPLAPAAVDAPTEARSSRSLPEAEPAKNLAPPPGLLAQLQRAATPPDPMARGVELLAGPTGNNHPSTNLAPDSSGDDHDPVTGGGHALDAHLGPAAGVIAAHLGETAHHVEVARAASASSVTDLAGLGPALRQVRRAPAQVAQRRATSGVVWPKDRTMPGVSPQPASIDGPPSTAPSEHPATHHTQDDAPSYAATAAPSPDAPAVVAPAKADAATPDAADVVRRALLLDRERSGSLADLW